VSDADFAAKLEAFIIEQARAKGGHLSGHCRAHRSQRHRQCHVLPGHLAALLQ
jgi:hypothetical protein